MNIAEIVRDATRVSQAADAPQAFRDIVVEHAMGSPVDLMAAVVRWAADLDDAEVSALSDDCWRAVYRCAEAVAAYRFHGLDQVTAGVLARRDPPPDKDDAAAAQSA